MQCTSMRGKTRCVLSRGHAGWHTDGAWAEWLADEERKAAYRLDPCGESTVTEGRTVPCELPKGHKIAHRGDGLIWSGPNPLPTPAERSQWFRVDSEDDGLPSII